jgi:hypothetical protein
LGRVATNLKTINNKEIILDKTSKKVTINRNRIKVMAKTKGTKEAKEDKIGSRKKIITGKDKRETLNTIKRNGKTIKVIESIITIKAPALRLKTYLIKSRKFKAAMMDLSFQ